MDDTTWVVVANSSSARIFRAEGFERTLVQVEDLAHPEGRLHETQMTSDLPGRTFDRFGQGRHAMEEDTPPKRHEAARFAKHISERLDSARTHGDFSRLVLVAEPRFLGLLRDNLSAESSKLATEQVDKDLVRFGPEEIRHRLSSQL